MTGTGPACLWVALATPLLGLLIPLLLERVEAVCTTRANVFRHRATSLGTHGSGPGTTVTARVGRS
jgi:hypothetical protein